MINLLLLAVAGLAALAALAAWFWLLVVAFRESPLWGFLTLFIPPVGLVFAITFWDDARRPFLAVTSASVVAAVLVAGVAMSTGKSVQRQFQLRMAEAAANARIGNSEDMSFEATPLPASAHSSVTDLPASPDPQSVEEEGLRNTVVETPEAAVSPSTISAPGAAPPAQTPRPVEPPAARSPSRIPAATSAPTTRGGRLPGQRSVNLAPSGPRAVPLADAHRFLGRRVTVETRQGRRETGRLLEVRGDRLVFKIYPAGGEMTFTLRRERIAELQIFPD